jgi:hypothetical protein
MNDDEKTQRLLAETRHNELVSLLKEILLVMTVPGYVPEFMKERVDQEKQKAKSE